MWSVLIILSLVSLGTLTEVPFGVTRYLSEGVKSAGYKIVYGDEELTLLNEVVDEYAKADVLKSKVNLNEALPPLPPEDVKCLMSVDRHCSKEMAQMKAVIIQAVKEDCKQCTDDQKEKAGKVIASMMAHDHTAWKLFLTRCALAAKPRNPPKEEDPKFKVVGKPEDVPDSKTRYIMPGTKVRVRRYVTKKL